MVCQQLCMCHHNTSSGENMMNCSGVPLKSLPESIPDNTTEIDLSHSKIASLCNAFPYLKNVTMLKLKSSNIGSICNGFVKSRWLHMHKGLIVDLQFNKLTTLPDEITKPKTVQWRISGNLFVCNCDALWIRDWFNDTGTLHPVLDYKYVRCHGGKFDGQPIYTLQGDKMGCLDQKLAKEAIISITCLLSIGFFILILVAFIIKRWNEIRWIIYKKANRFIGKGDKYEDLENMVFDAFISYR